MTKRGAIVDAAEQLFADRPYDAVGVAEIAQKAGVTKRTLYKHFATKEALYAAGLKARDLQLGKALRSFAEQHGNGDPPSELESIFIALGYSGDDGTFAGCPFTRSLSDLHGYPDNIGRKVSEAHKREMHEWISEKSINAGLGEANAMHVLTLYEGVLSRMLIEGSGESARQAITVLRLLMHADGNVRSSETEM